MEIAFMPGMTLCELDAKHRSKRKKKDRMVLMIWNRSDGRRSI
ncbi:hypothetical protein CEV33_4396 [Brucella grignonensis]|uniref:Uncharacterized protein n=1 Tax=Brucella grignonensis TaxID=94627 RepID=A0A256FNS7_9HYPH|nr:hypothetical protein CEV33_4396 [Brucella grignonensis]